MLLRVIFSCCVFAAYYSAAAPSIASASTDFLFSNASVPEKLAKFYFSLTADERSALSNVATKIKEGNVSIFDDAFSDILKLIRRFLAVFAAKDFSGVLSGFKGFGQEALSMYDALPQKTRQDFLSQFPTIGGLLTSDISRLMINKFSNFSADLSKIFDAILPSKKNSTATSVPNVTPAPVSGNVLPDTPPASKRVYPDVPGGRKIVPNAGKKGLPDEPAGNKIYPDVPAGDKMEEEIKKVIVDTS